MKSDKKYTRKLLAAVFMFLLAGCSDDEKSCYDQQLYDDHHNDICTMDCPGVTGCDGKFYCNECIANTHGIRVEH